MRYVKVQTDFTAGEIDPLLRGRIDLQQYSKGLQEATNVIIQPQGGAKRRPGLKYLGTLPGAASPENGVRLVPFEFSTADSYMLVFVNARMYIYKGGTLQTNINGSGNDYLAVSNITSSVLGEMTWVQSADTLIVFHEDMAPQKIQRTTSDSTWTVADVTWDFIPKYAFSLNITSPSATLTPSATSGNITLTAGASIFHSGRSNTAQAGGASTITLDTGASATDDIYNGSTIEITGGTGSGQTRVIDDYVGTTKVATVDSAWDTQPDNTSTFTVSSHVNQYVNGTESFGRARIIKVNSATEVEAATETPFFDTSSIASGEWELEQGYEDAWSTANGWPRSGVFHEGRLYIGGAKSLPATVWGSRVADFFNFDPGEGLDDESVERTIETNTFNAIVDCYSGRDLQFFTTAGEFYVPQVTDDPVTPANFIVKPATKNGTKEGVRVQGIDGGTLYIQRQGKSLNELLFSEAEQAFVSSQVSTLSSHLLKTPTTMTVRRATSTDEGDLLLIVNSNGGSIAAYSILRSQAVVAASEFETEGEFQDVGVDIDTIYAVVKRTFDSTDYYFVEVFDSSFTTDCAVSGGAVSSVSGTHLISETCDLILDGLVQAAQTTDGSGDLTFPRASTSSYELGLPYDVTLETMPVELSIQSGTLQGKKKRIVEVNALVKDTQSLTINSVEVPFRRFDTAVLDSPVAEFTGTKTLTSLLGWSRDAVVSVGQATPLKMTLLALDYRIAVRTEA